MPTDNGVGKAFEEVVHEAVVPQASFPDELLQPCFAHPAAAVQLL